VLLVPLVWAAAALLMARREGRHDGWGD
jgi:hypothetical protein